MSCTISALTSIFTLCVIESLFPCGWEKRTLLKTPTSRHRPAWTCCSFTRVRNVVQVIMFCSGLFEIVTGYVLLQVIRDCYRLLCFVTGCSRSLHAMFCYRLCFVTCDVWLQIVWDCYRLLQIMFCCRFSETVTDGYALLQVARLLQAVLCCYTLFEIVTCYVLLQVVRYYYRLLCFVTC